MSKRTRAGESDTKKRLGEDVWKGGERRTGERAEPCIALTMACSKRKGEKKKRPPRHTHDCCFGVGASQLTAVSFDRRV
eukprot:5815768-Pleurochrysis_carterae.AAC.2